jgi:hypothetical protein
MRKIELFIKERRIKIKDIEEELGIPRRSIQMTKGRGIPDKYISIVTELLVSKYGYVDDNSLADVDIPEKFPEKVVKINYRWNKNFVPKYTDGIIRYQDPENGLWRRLWEYQSYIEKSKDDNGKEIKTRKIRKEFLPETGEVLRDKIGEYYIARNGIKVYSFKGDLGKIN